MPIAQPIRVLLEKLPISSATWCAGSVVVDPALTDGIFRTYLICTQGDGVVRAEQTVDGLATDAVWSKNLARAMQFAPKGGRAMVPKVIKVADAALAALLLPILAPLKVKLELTARPLAISARIEALAAPAGPNPPTLAQEQSLWQQLFHLHAIHLVGDEDCDLLFGMTTEIAGWEAPVVRWCAVDPDAEEGEDGESLHVYHTDADRARAEADTDGLALDLQFFQVTFEDPHGAGGTAWRRALARNLDHLHCHVPVMTAFDPGLPDPREHLDETETSVLLLVAQAVRAWAALHRVGPFAVGGDAEVPGPPLPELLAVPDTQTTIVWLGSGYDAP